MKDKGGESRARGFEEPNEEVLVTDHKALFFASQDNTGSGYRQATAQIGDLGGRSL